MQAGQEHWKTGKLREKEAQEKRKERWFTERRCALGSLKCSKQEIPLAGYLGQESQGAPEKLFGMEKESANYTVVAQGHFILLQPKQTEGHPHSYTTPSREYHHQHFQRPRPARTNTR